MITSICIPCSWDSDPLEPTTRKYFRTSWHNLSSIRLSGLMAWTHTEMEIFWDNKYVPWNLVLQNAKDSKELWSTLPHSASHIMQAKNSTKCNLSHFNWDHIRVWNWATNPSPTALPETDLSPVKMNGWQKRFPFDPFGSFALGYWGYFSFRGTWQEKEQKYEILKDQST